MGHKILIVDDDSDVLFVLKHILNKAGYKVVSATSGGEGLEKVAKESPDLVILDVMMPDMNGWDVCKKIKEDSPDLPVSMCSILRKMHEIEKSFNYAGADRHITKPISFENVLNTVSALLSAAPT